MLGFDYIRRIWQWDLAQIQVRGVTDNVVSLMTGKIQKLPDQAQQVLQLAACIGNQFELSTLAVVCQKSPRETSLELSLALSEGLVIPLNDAYKSIELGTDSEAPDRASADDRNSIAYKFIHDRIQQAAYSLIPDESKQVVHRQVGQLLLQSIPADEREEKIF